MQQSTEVRERSSSTHTTTNTEVPSHQAVFHLTLAVLNMSDGQSPPYKRSEAEGDRSASLTGGASSSAPASEGDDLSCGKKPKGKEHFTRSIFERMLDTTSESRNDKSPNGCGGGEHPT